MPPHAQNCFGLLDEEGHSAAKWWQKQIGGRLLPRTLCNFVDSCVVDDVPRSLADLVTGYHALHNDAIITELHLAIEESREDVVLEQLQTDQFQSIVRQIAALLSAAGAALAVKNRRYRELPDWLCRAASPNGRPAAMPSALADVVCGGPSTEAAEVWLDRTLVTMGVAPDRCPQVRLAIRHFLNPQAQSPPNRNSPDKPLEALGKAERIPILTLNLGDGRPGEVGRMELRLYGEGTGQVVADPLMLGWFDDKWTGAIAESWGRWQDNFPGQDLVWSYQPPADKENDNQCKLVMHGPSLQAACDTGLLLLSQKRRYDPDVAISAIVSTSDGRRLLMPVAGLFAPDGKLGPKLLPQDMVGEQLRLIIVSANQWEHDGIKDAVKDAILAEAKRLGIEIVCCATVEEAAERASKLHEGIARYLENLKNNVDKRQPSYFGNDRQLSDLYVQPDVLKRKMRTPDSERAASPAARTLIEEQRQYEEALGNEEAEWERVSWDRERLRLRGVSAIVGPPGSGKTVLTQMTTRCIAEESLRRLQQGISIAEIDIPFRLVLNDIANAGSIAAALRQQLRKLGCDQTAVGYLSSPAVLASPRSWLLLDALDEVTEPQQLETALKVIRESNWQGRIVLTGRPYRYDEERGNLGLSISPSHEYQLAPLLPRQRDKFIECWFQENAEGQKRVEDLLGRNPQLGSVGSNPHLLTMACFAVELDPEGSAEWQTRVDLYRAVLPELIRRVRKEGIPELSPRVQDNLIDIVLPHLAWLLFEKSPSNNYSNLAFDAVEDQLISHYGEKYPRFPWDDAWDRLLGAGLLAKQGDGGWMFAHRTFLEYLAGKHLSRRKDCLKKATGYYRWRWDAEHEVERWDTSAGEMLCFLAGCLDAPRPLIEAVYQQHIDQPDLGNSMLILAGRMMGDVRDDVLGPWKTADEITASLREASMSCHRASQQSILTGMRHRRGVAVFLVDLRHENALIRYLGVSRLGQVGTSEALSALIKQLGDTEIFVCQTVVKELGRLGARKAVPALIEQLSHEFTVIRSDAASVLGGLGDRAAVPALIERLEDKDKQVRQNAAEALGQLGDRDAVSALNKRLEDEDYSVRRKAVEALGLLVAREAVPDLIKQLDDLNSLMRERAVLLLGYLGARQAVPALIKLLANRDDPLRSCAAEALGLLGATEVVPVLIEHLEDEDDGVRWHAAEALGELGDRTAVPALIGRLEDNDGDARSCAARALGRLGDRNAVPALIKRLEDEHHWVRWIAAGALGQLGDRDAVPALIKRLEDEDDGVRREAAEALGELGDRTAVPALIGLLEDKDEFVRLYAARALGRLGDRNAVPALIAHFRPEGLVSSSAIEKSLQAIGLHSLKYLMLYGNPDNRDVIKFAAHLAHGLGVRFSRNPLSRNPPPLLVRISNFLSAIAPGFRGFRRI